jgi:putative acetyltransferase
VTGPDADARTAPRVLVVRRELAEDQARVHALVTAAFSKGPDAPGTAEAGLIEALRACPDWISELSMVAEMDGVVVGHVVCSRGRVAGRPVLALGPLGVDPAYQGLGVGTALVHAVIGAGEAMGEPLVVLLGHLDYYPRFGFVPGTSLGVIPPVQRWGDHFQVRPLTTYDPTLRGPFAYATPFNDL